MALDPTARESNVRDSIKKYFVDSLYKANGVELLFDKGLESPNLQNKTVTRWVSINFNTIERSKLSSLLLDLHCCTREDNEGFKLAQLTDLVIGYLTDTTVSDTMKRIPLYRSYPDAPWEIIGYFLVQEIMESQQYEFADLTKFKTITVRLRWASYI